MPLKGIVGKEPTLLKVNYCRANRDRKECFQVIYMDDNGKIRYYEALPEADIYIVKPEYRDYAYNKPQERMEKMYKIRTPISQIRNVIAEQAGEWGKRIKQMARDRHDIRIESQLYKWPYAYACDFQPEYYFMKDWYDQYPLKTPKLSKAFLDIEVDMIDYTVDMDDVESTAYAPVNLVTVILEETKEAHTFILRPYAPTKGGRSEEEYAERYKLYQKQLQDHEALMNNPDEFYKRLHDSFDGTYGYLNYNLHQYEWEIDLICDVFKLINLRKPNFCMIWNMRFDIPYLISRLEVLGYPVEDAICSPELPSKVAKFKKDTSTFMLEKQYDFFYVASFTQYICQMRLEHMASLNSLNCGNEPVRH